MIKYLLVLCSFLFFSLNLFAQASYPSGYTTNYGFRLYSQGAKPGSDSLNQNFIDIDNYIHARHAELIDSASAFRIALVDSVSALRTAIAGVSTASFVDLTNDQLIDGNKTFYGMTKLGGVQLTAAVPTISGDITQWSTTDGDFMVLTPPTGGISGLATLNGGVDGQIFIILLNPTSIDAAVIKNGTGNIFLGCIGDRYMYATDTLTLICYGGNWYEVSHSSRTYSATAPPLQH